MNESNIKVKRQLEGKFYIETLGCSKNQVDSEFLAGRLIESGFEWTMDVDEADCIVINTCGFISDAMEESVNAIIGYGGLKGKDQILVAAGCLTERFALEIQKELPEIDLIVGVSRFLELPDMIADFRRDGAKSMRVGDIDRYVDYSPKERMLLDSGHYAYVKISEGCDNRCTYCTIPGFKGKYKSRRIEDILLEARNLAERGVKEIILIAQDTTKYGIDIYREYKLVDLLNRLVEVDGIEWIRILYAYPDVLDPELVKTMESNSKICNYLDIPIQHSNDQVLRSMNRHTSNSDLERTLSMIKRIIPDISIRTTLMVGFPGETEEAFEELVDFVERHEFDRLGVFEYSPEEGTPAATFEGQVENETKTVRKDRIMMVQRVISERANQKKIGNSMKVVIDEKVQDEAVYLGRTEYDAPEVDGVVYVNSERELEIGDFISVRITDALEYDLIGVVEDEFAE